MSKRNAILTAATRLFSRNGFKETSMAELSQMTGAASGTIFHHFKNKEDLFCKVLQRVEQTITADFRDRARQHLDCSGYQRTLRAVGDYLHLVGTYQDQILLLHRHYPYQKAETSPECRKALESVYTCLLDTFEDCISAGLTDGTVTTAPPRNSAMLLFALVDGVSRLHTHHIYHAGSLHQDLMAACGRILNPEDPMEKGSPPCHA